MEILSFKRKMKSKSTVNNKILLLTILRTPKVKLFIPYLVGSDWRTEKERLRPRLRNDRCIYALQSKRRKIGTKKNYTSVTMTLDLLRTPKKKNFCTKLGRL